MNLEDKKVLVVGLGRTGEALCDFLLQHGAHVKVSERKTREELGPEITDWENKGIVMETGKHTEASFIEADLVVPSPGVPWIPELDSAVKKGIRILSEIELASLFLKGKIVGITGTNGKSTTATLTYQILKEGGDFAGGIGRCFTRFVGGRCFLARFRDLTGAGKSLLPDGRRGRHQKPDHKSGQAEKTCASHDD